MSTEWARWPFGGHIYNHQVHGDFQLKLRSGHETNCFMTPILDSECMETLGYRL